MHLWDLDAGRHPWLDADDPEVTRLIALVGSYAVADYRRDSAAWTPAAVVHVQAGWDPSDPVGETRWLQALHDRTGTPTAVVAAASLESPDARATLEAHAGHATVRGVRQMLNWCEIPACSDAPRALMETREWRRGFGLLAGLGLSFDLTIYPHQLAEAARLARDHPRTILVLDHVGLPGVVADDDGVWRAGLRRLAECENVSAKLSGLSRPGGGRAQMTERVEEVLELFGCERCMFGSNLPVERLHGSAALAVEAVADALARRSAHEREAVWRTTATRVYRIESVRASADPTTAEAR